MERWANKLNDFCHYCTGNDSVTTRKAIWRCKDRNCPFWRDRFANLPYQEKRKEDLNNDNTEINRKIKNYPRNME